MNNPTCVVCGRQITWRFSLCGACENRYGNRAGDWPEWLRYLVNQSRRERRANERINKYEVSMSDLEEDIDTPYVEEWDEDRF